MFREKFTKFVKTIADYNIIPVESKKIVIAMSGGKDGAVMAHFLLEYKRLKRPDIEIEMLTAPMPKIEHHPQELINTDIDSRQRKMLEEQIVSLRVFSEYWQNHLKCITVPVEHELYEDRILKMKWPCIMCFCTKMKAFHKYLADQPYDDNTLLALGWTKWDSHYTLISHLMKSNGLKWHELKLSDPKKYKADCQFLASFLAYPKVDIGIPGKKIYRINPMIEFDDNETSSLADEIGFPIVKDICKEFYGNMFDQDRRYLSKYLELYSLNHKHLNLSQESFLFNIRNLFQFMENVEIIPPLKELEGRIYDTYNSNFEEIFELLKN